MKTAAADRALDRLLSEQINPASRNLDQKSALQIARIINTEDAKVAGVVRRTLPRVAQAIDVIAHSLSQGGRLIYVGTGTSGRIAALDAAECPPTFGIDSKTVQFVVAGGSKALASAVEGSEDSVPAGTAVLARLKLKPTDVVVGIAASGRTPFTIAALKYARKEGARTIALTSNRNSLLGKSADLEIVTEVGPEVIVGSTRMKAGSAHKMVLNMLSTGAMTRLGYVYGNLMVRVQIKNRKLAERAVRILQLATSRDRRAVQRALRVASNRVPLALIMLKTGVDVHSAQRALADANGNVRKGIASAAKRAGE